MNLKDVGAVTSGRELLYGGCTSTARAALVCLENERFGGYCPELLGHVFVEGYELSVRPGTSWLVPESIADGAWMRVEILNDGFHVGGLDLPNWLIVISCTASRWNNIVGNEMTEITIVTASASPKVYPARLRCISTPSSLIVAIHPVGIASVRLARESRLQTRRVGQPVVPIEINPREVKASRLIDREGRIRWGWEWSVAAIPSN